METSLWDFRLFISAIILTFIVILIFVFFYLVYQKHFSKKEIQEGLSSANSSRLVAISHTLDTYIPSSISDEDNARIRDHMNHMISQTNQLEVVPVDETLFKKYLSTMQTDMSNCLATPLLSSNTKDILTTSFSLIGQALQNFSSKPSY